MHGPNELHDHNVNKVNFNILTNIHINTDMEDFWPENKILKLSHYFYYSMIFSYLKSERGRQASDVAENFTDKEPVQVWQDFPKETAMIQTFKICANILV